MAVNPHRKTSTEPESGWHKIPDAVVDELLLKSKLSPGGLQLALLLIIQRHTWGAKGRPGWTKGLSIAKLAKMCSSGRGKGDGYTPRAIATALNDLMARGIIAGKNAKGQPLRAALAPEERTKAVKSTAAAMYQSTPERWKAAPRYVAPEVDEDEPIEAAPEVDEDEPIEAAPSKSTPIVLRPGAKSKPMPMRIIVKGRDPVDISWRAHNTSPAELSFHASPGADGITFVVAQKGEAQNGEGKANDYVSRVQQPEAAGYREFVSALVLDRWSKPADEDLIARIVKAAAGAPVERFRAIVAQRCSSRKRFETGLLIELAKDAAAAHRAASGIVGRARAAEGGGAEDDSYWRGDTDSRWAGVLKAIRQQVSDFEYENWFERSRFVSLEAGVLTVEVPNASVAEFVSDEYGALIGTTARAMHGLHARSVRIVPRERAKGAVA